MIINDKERSILQKYRPLLESNPPRIQEFYENLIMEENLSTVAIGRFIQMFPTKTRHRILYSLDYLPEGFLAKCPLEFITIPKGIETIGAGCFLQAPNLSHVKFEEECICRHIHYGAFDRCSKLSRVELPESILSIGEYCFNECNSLTELYYKGSALKFSTIDLKRNWLGDSKIKKIICNDKELKVNG